MPAIQFRPGRKAPHSSETHPRIYATRVLTGYTGTVPAVVDWHTRLVFPMLANDSVGDCTEADSGHAIGVFTGENGQEVVLTDQDVLTAYSRVTGYDPAQTQPDGSNPTDTGANIQDVLDDWRRNGIAGHTILAFGQVDHTSQDEIKACCWLFGGVRLGVNLPKSAEDQFNNGQGWTYDPNADNTILGGHDVRIVGFDTTGFYVATWGAVILVTWEWITHWAEEAWFEASEDWVHNHTAPNGLPESALNSAFEEVVPGQAGPFPVGPNPQPGPTPNPPGPAPSPTPGPTPDPGPVVAADQQLAETVKPLLAHLHHGSHAARQVADALITWLAETGL